MKNSKGITLVALVISIIVMLILAGVSLSATIGENGILKQAQQATEATRKAATEEEAQFDIFDMQTAEMVKKESWDTILNADTSNSAAGEGEQSALEKFQSTFAGGTGTQSDPYQITNALQLAYLAKYTNEKSEFVEGSYFKLMNDLDLEYREWTAIGIGATNATGTSTATVNKLAETAFKGYFDGAGHKISKIYINQPNNCAVGLFGTLDGNAVIQNITMESGRVIGKYHVGGIVGASINGTVKNCINKAEVIAQDNVSGSSGEQAGGIMGTMIYGTTILEDCTNYGNVTTKDDANLDSRGKCAGGILGSGSSYTENNVEICGNYTIKNCVNHGTVVSHYQKVGGIVADYMNGTIENCRNHGKVIGYKYKEKNNSGSFVGGIVGYAFGGALTNSQNTGEIICDISCIGGIVGRNVDMVVSNCENSGKIQQLCKIKFSSNINMIGGISGDNQGIVEYCYNAGTIESAIVEGFPECAGGIVGLSREDGITRYCFNSGTVINSSKLGGVLGQLQTGSLAKNYYYSDTITAGIGCTSSDLNATANGSDVTGQAEKIDSSEIGSVSSFESFKSWITTK